MALFVFFFMSQLDAVRRNALNYIYCADLEELRLRLFEPNFNPMTRTSSHKFGPVVM